MCDLCSSAEHLPEPEVFEEQGRLEQAGAALAVMAVNESSKLPLAEVAAVCGCGACGVCRMTFVGASVLKAYEGLKNFFGNWRERAAKRRDKYDLANVEAHFRLGDIVPAGFDLGNATTRQQNYVQSQLQEEAELRLILGDE